MAINQINYRERFVCMIREDIVDFAMLLRAHFPTIRFVSIDTGERWVVASGSAEQRNVRWKPDHQPHALTYYEPDKVPNGFHAWLEPPGWRPIWLATSERITALRASGLSTQHSPEDMAGVYEIANVPRAQFAISGSYRIPGSSRPKYAVGSMLTQFAPGANEAVRFFNRAVRLLETISSNGMVFADPDIDADLVRPFQSHIWVGFHARRLILSDPEITISGDLRPSADDRPWMGRPYSALENEIAAEAKRPRSSDEVVRYQSLPLFLIEEDYAALLAAIRAAIPDVRIVPYLYDWHVEYRPYPDDRASHRAWFTPGKGTIEYLDRLDAPLHNRVYAWCEPPGWQ
ncbi:MAG: hypothetical protein KIT18_10105, partial [Burkholderiales bacterium]|nr:hypothetical protein [Burkholderiales bacterium]